MLQQLITEALKNNYDVKIAADRVLEEQAQLGITKSAQYPTLNVGASYDALGLPGGLFSSLNNGSNSSSSSSSNSQTNYFAGGLTASAAWNLDFWGYYRRQTEAARANLRATEWARQTTYSTLVEDVASSYYQLRTLDAELAITKNTLDARKQSLALTQTLEQGGADSLADVRQAEELYYTAQAQIPDLERQIEQQENNLRLLLGQDPGPIVRDVADSASIIANAPHPSDVPVGLPSDLLERRPDVRRAEELLIQANANIGVARAQYFPQLSLSATGGTSSSQLKGLVESGNAYYYAIGSLSQPIFDAGKIRNNYRLAKADRQGACSTPISRPSPARCAMSRTPSSPTTRPANTASSRRSKRPPPPTPCASRACATTADPPAILKSLPPIRISTTRNSRSRRRNSRKLSRSSSLYNALGGGW